MRIKLERIGKEYKSGEMLTTEIKDILIDVLVGMTSNHKKERDEVSLDVVNQFMEVRKLDF